MRIRERLNATSTASGATATYSYDCKSLRVKKVSGGTTTVYIFSGGKVIAEYVNGAAPTAPSREYVYSGATLLAQIAGGATYYHPDHLSPRLLTDSSGNITGQQGHFPFGEMWYDSGTTKWKFTTYERDDESGNDYAMARYDVSRLGRFSAPDPLAGSTISPQSLNRYSYVANDPINYHDPSGQFLTALTLFLDRWDFPQFGENWDEFHFMEPRQTGTLYWFRSNRSTFDFEDASTSDLLRDADDGEIQLVKEFPMFGNSYLINQAGGSLAPLKARDQNRYLKSLAKLLSNLSNNTDCIDFLVNHGIDPTLVAIGAINQKAYSGNDSSASLQQGGIANNNPGNASQSVGDFFRQNPNVNAAAQPLGPNVFFRNGGLFDSHVGVGTVGHELMHNVTGLSDSALETQLGLPQGASVEISNAVNEHCNH